MAKAENAKSRARVKRLYFSAKISDYQFKKVLWHFVRDHSVAEAAKHINLSANSISAIYAKLRKFFFEHRLFKDIYKGGDPKEGTGDAEDEIFEFGLLDFHLKRVTQRHGNLDSAMDKPDYHFGESFWRHQYRLLMQERPPEMVHGMMYDHLFAFIRRFGPVGKPNAPPSQEQLAGKKLALEQFDQHILWLERNSAQFNDVKRRTELLAIRNG